MSDIHGGVMSDTRNEGREEPVYVGLLDELDPGWRDEDKQVGNAGMALIANLIENGHAYVPRACREMPDFAPQDIREAAINLRKGGLLSGSRFKPVIRADEDEIQSGMWWVLTGSMAMGYMELVR